MIKIPISQQGAAVTYLCSEGYLYHGPGHVDIFYWQQTEQPNVPTDPGPPKTMEVDNSTRIPCVMPDGTPVLETVLLFTGKYERVRDVVGRDENGQDILGEPYTDHEKPIREPVEQPRTVGEYFAVRWWHWDPRNTLPQPSICEMIEEGIRRRLGISQQPYHFVITPEFTQVFGNDY